MTLLLSLAFAGAPPTDAYSHGLGDGEIAARQASVAQPLALSAGVGCVAGMLTCGGGLGMYTGNEEAAVLGGIAMVGAAGLGGVPWLQTMDAPDPVDPDDAYARGWADGYQAMYEKRRRRAIVGGTVLGLTAGAGAVGAGTAVVIVLFLATSTVGVQPQMDSSQAIRF